MKTYKELMNEITEVFDPWDDHSHKYTLKKGEKKSTIAHPEGKHVMHVIHKDSGEEVGKISPYSGYKDKSKPGSRVVSSRKEVTKYSFMFNKDHGPESHKMGSYTTSEHSSPAAALKSMAREHQKHLNTKK
jgi:hypothetical protein